MPRSALKPLFVCCAFLDRCLSVAIACAWLLCTVCGRSEYGPACPLQPFSALQAKLALELIGDGMVRNPVLRLSGQFNSLHRPVRPRPPNSALRRAARCATSHGDAGGADREHTTAWRCTRGVGVCDPSSLRTHKHLKRTPGDSTAPVLVLSVLWLDCTLFVLTVRILYISFLETVDIFGCPWLWRM